MDISRKCCVFLLFILFLSSCTVTKHLNSDQHLITKNTVVVHDKIKNKDDIRYELSTYIKQKPNEKLFGFLTRSKLWVYYRTNDPADTSSFDKWAQRVLAEPPAIHDPKLTEASRKNMENYMKNKGYWNTEVTVDSVKRKKKIKMQYNVYPNQLFSFTEDVVFTSRDTNIQQILNETAEKSFLKKGQPIDAESYNKEVQRITQKLRNSGYAFFSSSYVDQLEIDTIGSRLTGELRILSYNDSLNHPVYTIGDLYIFPDYTASFAERSFGTYVYDFDNGRNTAKFITEEPEIGIKPGVVLDHVYFRKGDIYQKNLIDKSSYSLEKLAWYRYVRIEQEISPSNPSVLDFYIRMVPQKRWVIGYDLEANSSSINQSNSLFGASLQLNLRNRNLFRGAEVFNNNLNFGIEFPQSFDRGVINTLDIKAQSELVIPKLVDPLRLYSLFGGLLLNEEAEQFTRESAVSSLSATYNYLSILNFYQYNQFDFSFGYNIQPSQNRSLFIQPLGIEFIQANTEPAFDEILDNNPFLRASFDSLQLFTGFLLRKINYTWKRPSSLRSKIWTLNANFEISGLEVLALNSLTNLFSNNNTNYTAFGIPFSQFASLGFDARYFKQLSPGYSFAAHINTGIAMPFGNSTTEVPFVKQFFVGGLNSIRAWPIRSIGPGGVLAVEPPNNTPYFQTGDFKLEGSIEYRFDMFSFFEGAVFLDAGNIWTLNDTTRTLSQFSLKRERHPDTGALLRDFFWDQIAIGTGFGLRMDFQYFIIRLDLGYPLKFPQPQANGRYWDFSTNRQGAFHVNFGLGYAF